MDTLPCLPKKLVQLPVLIRTTEPPRENAEARLGGRVVLLSHSDLDSSDGASLMSTHTRTCSCCASNLIHIRGRQAMLLQSVGASVVQPFLPSQPPSTTSFLVTCWCFSVHTSWVFLRSKAWIGSNHTPSFSSTCPSNRRVCHCGHLMPKSRVSHMTAPANPLTCFHVCTSKNCVLQSFCCSLPHLPSQTPSCPSERGHCGKFFLNLQIIHLHEK